MEEHVHTTPDGDFITVASLKRGYSDAIVVLHGLNGSYQSVYVQGILKALQDVPADLFSYNQRGCGPVFNKTDKLYHCGFTEDVDYLLRHGLSSYNMVHFVGVSLGANVVLKYIGELGQNIPERLGEVIAINPPGPLTSGARHLDNSVYRVYFLMEMRRKGILKGKQFPDKIDIRKVRKALSLIAVDKHVTAPLAGYDDVWEYYKDASWTSFIDSIHKKTYLLTALDDPFFPRKDPPEKYCADHPYLEAHVTKYGGHAGHFYSHGRLSYHEIWVRDLINRLIRQ